MLKGLSDYLNPAKLFGKKKEIATATAIPCLAFDDVFAERMIKQLYKRLLTEAYDRAVIPTKFDAEEMRLTTFDSFAPYREGLMSLISEAMVRQQHVFYRKIPISGDWYRFEEVTGASEIYSDFEKKKIKPDILELNFTEYWQAHMLLLLAQLISQLLLALNRGVVVSSTLLIKINKLSEMINSVQEQEPLERQVKNIRDGLQNGTGAYIDAQSSVEFNKYDPTPVKEAIDFIYGIIAQILGHSRGTIFGEVVGGLGDMSAGEVSRDNIAYRVLFYNVWFGVLYAVYNAKCGYADPADLEHIQKVFDFIESTTSLTEDAKKKFIVANTQFENRDIALGQPEPEPVPVPPAAIEGGEL